MQPLPSPAWRGCRPQAAGVEGTPSLLYQSPLNAPDLSLNLCVFSRLGGQLFRLPSTPGPASPVHPLQAGEGFSLFRQLLPFHGVSPGTFLFVEHSDLAPPALYAFRGCRPQAAGVEGTPSLLYQSPLNAPDLSLNLCVFSRLGGQLFRLPSTPGPASPVHPLQAGEGFCSVPSALFFFTEAGEPDCLAHAAELLIHVPV